MSICMFLLLGYVMVYRRLEVESRVGYSFRFWEYSKIFYVYAKGVWSVRGTGGT